MNIAVRHAIPARANIRKAITYNRALSRSVAEGNQNYRIDRRCADEYLNGLPAWREVVTQYLRALNEEGIEPVFVDVCGRSMGSYIGAKKHYSFSLQPPRKHGFVADNEYRVQGDIFSAKDFYAFVNLLRERGDRPAFVTFVPVAGLQYHIPRIRPRPGEPLLHGQVTYQRLINALRKMVEITRPGGYLFLQCPFQFMTIGDFLSRKSVEGYESAVWMRAFAKDHGCRMQVINTMNGPRFLLRKR